MMIINCLTQRRELEALPKAWHGKVKEVSANLWIGGISGSELLSALANWGLPGDRYIKTFFSVCSLFANTGALFPPWKYGTY